ncbi:MAG: RsmB/NOP family class I SAM-dependent RNA methyltransferase [Pseudomonadota bacterium]|nr:RsmB/NOP family class I SAM-dependent RNA methyltransferase [Pseudomonadota bacterium]
MAISQAQFDVLVHALIQVGSLNAPADTLLKQFFRDRAALGPRDRTLVAESVYAALRRSRYLEQLVPGGEPRRLAFAVLAMLRGYSLRELEPLCRGSEQEWLQTLRGRSSEGGELGLQAELPDWVIERLRADHDDAGILALGRAMQQPAPLDLRVNTLKARPEDVRAELAAAGVEAEPTPYSPVGLRVRGKPALQELPVFREGRIEVQDEGSQLLGYLLAPRRGEMVVDFCAGAGGKTLLLGALMQNEGRLYAFDVSERRLANLRPRLKRSGLSNVNPVLITGERDTRVKRLAGKVDRVLVDAPCSGLGTLRRNPDLKQRQGPESIDELCAKQDAILDAAATLLKPGGLLVYATCSLLADENQRRAEAFSERRTDFELQDCGQLLAQARIPLEMGRYLQLWPQVHGTDGFFAAAWRRAPAGGKA